MSSRRIVRYVGRALVRGALFVVPIYLAGLLLLKAASTVAVAVRPLVDLFPGWFPGERVLSVLLVLAVLFVVGAIALTPRGRVECDRLEKSLFRRIPGYALFRSLTRQLADQGEDNVWKPALVEIEEALVPAFIIETLDDDGQFTVFVPSAPTPLAGTIYVLEAHRVHPLDVSFAELVRTISHWGEGSKRLMAARHPTAAPR